MTRLNLIGANGWFMLIFTGTLFPFQMYLVPLLFGYQRLGLVNTWFGMLLVYVAICIPFPLLVLRNSFSGISREVDEAARIEGASEWRVFISMIIPNAKGPLIALFLLQFTFIWNDLLFSSILANGIEVRSVMVALQSLQGTYSTLGPNVVDHRGADLEHPDGAAVHCAEEILHGRPAARHEMSGGTPMKRRKDSNAAVEVAPTALCLPARERFDRDAGL